MGEARGDGNAGEALNDPDVDDEAFFTERLDQAWKTLKGKVAPADPDALTEFLVHCFVWQGAPHQLPQPDRWQLEDRVDEAFKKFIFAARELRSALPTSKHYHVLRELMHERIRHTENYALDQIYFEQIDVLLPIILYSPNLIPRQLSRAANYTQTSNENDRKSHIKRFPNSGKIKNQYTRSVVRAICWYLLNIEGVEPKRSFIGKNPISQAAVISHIALNIFDLCTDNLEGHLKAVLSESEWRTSAYGYYDNLPKVPRPARP